MPKCHNGHPWDCPGHTHAGELPECGGAHDPGLCAPMPHRALDARSVYESSHRHGWPARRGGAADPRPCPPGAVRVAALTPSLYLGGSERWLLTLLASCDPARIHWTGVAALDGSLGLPELVAEAARVCPVVTGRRAAAELARRSDILLSWGIPDAALLAGPAASVMVSHATGPAAAELLRDAGRSEGLAAVSTAAADAYPEAERHRVEVIPNGIDPARVVPRRTRALVRASWGIPEGARVLGCLQRRSPEKNPTALARAVAELPPEWYGVMVGAGLDAAAVEAEAAIVAPGRVVFPGAELEDIGGALAAFDWFLLPSHREAASLALIEAWLAGVPALATPVGHAADLPGLVRLLPLDPSGPAVAAALAADLADPGGTARRVDLARATAAELYTAGPFGVRWTDFLCRIHRRRGKARGNLAETIGRCLPCEQRRNRGD